VNSSGSDLSSLERDLLWIELLGDLLRDSSRELIDAQIESLKIQLRVIEKEINISNPNFGGYEFGEHINEAGYLELVKYIPEYCKPRISMLMQSYWQRQSDTECTARDLEYELTNLQDLITKTRNYVHPVPAECKAVNQEVHNSVLKFIVSWGLLILILIILLVIAVYLFTRPIK
jgi:hypothetical protein